MTTQHEKMLLREAYEALDFSILPDDILFAKGDNALCWRTDEEGAALKAEKAKRTAIKEQQKARQEQERATRLYAQKSSIQYSDTLANEICERVSAGELLINICKEDQMPLSKNVRRLLTDHKDFAQLFKIAIADRLFIFEEETVQLADDKSQDISKNGKPNAVSVQRAKVQIDIRLRHLKAHQPKVWGDSVTVNNVNESEDLSGMDDIEIEEHIAELERKSASVKRGTIGNDIGSYRERDNVTELKP